MIRMIKNNRWFLLFVIGAGLAGGYALGLWETADLNAAVQAQMAAQGMSAFQLVLITALQAGFLYGGLLGVLGLWLSRKVGYWRPITFQPKRVGLAALLGCLVGLLLFPLDGLVFGGSTELASWSHLQPASLAEWIGSVLYGGVIEEVMLRLFWLSLIAFGLQWIFARNQRPLPSWIGWTANIAAALLFAAGHLPATAAMTALTPVVMVRCFVLNGAGGLVFGWLYEKEGIQYAMIAHAMAHVFSKLLIGIFF